MSRVHFFCLQDLTAQDSMFALELVAVESCMDRVTTLAAPPGSAGESLLLHVDPDATGLDAAAASLAASQQAVAAGWGVVQGHLGNNQVRDWESCGQWTALQVSMIGPFQRLVVC
jgi:hypothetical protein